MPPSPKKALGKGSNAPGSSSKENSGSEQPTPEQVLGQGSNAPGSSSNGNKTKPVLCSQPSRQQLTQTAPPCFILYPQPPPLPQSQFYPWHSTPHHLNLSPTQFNSFITLTSPRGQASSAKPSHHVHNSRPLLCSAAPPAPRRRSSQAAQKFSLTVDNRTQET
ncbi:hypothetical protein M0R45_000319 [Rubus argutus]|uniref:Uncharacterized protein n=1 Tax=Rubus argutus TaxID=59490 RepID=A0AAW1VNJ1_RUBAR